MYHSSLNKLSVCEREYVGQMQRREKDELLHVICRSDGSKKQQHVNSNNKRRRSVSPPLRIQVLQSRLPEDVRLRIFDTLGRSSSSCDKYTTWVRRLLELPLDVYHHNDGHGHGELDVGCAVVPSTLADVVERALARAKTVMDEHVTGHSEAKVEILKLVCQTCVAGPNATKGAGAPLYSLGFEGPPGVGKTHFVRVALAAALRRPLVTIPLGGANDIGYLLGNLYVYEGSKEGRLAAGLIEARCCNPIIYFDELDKVSTSERGMELTSALIHLVDPTANMDLRDRYFHGVDIDFSKCTFVFSYNDATRVSPILLDRIKRIRMPLPTEVERRSIVTKHLVPRVQHRLCTQLQPSTLATDAIVRRTVGGGGGMRSAEKDVDHVISSAQLCVACGCLDGTIVGVPSTKVLDVDGHIGADFAEHVLALCSATSAETNVFATSMYM